MVRYAITGENPTPAEVAHVAALADFIQLRTPGWDAGPTLHLLRQLGPTLVAEKMLVHGRADVALAIHAAGVHLSSRPGELTVEQVKKLLPQARISVSAHTLDEVHRAASADFILFGPVFEKRVLGELVVPGVGLDLLRQACTVAPGKVLALGGVTAENAPECLAAGAAGIAGIRLFQAPVP